MTFTYVMARQEDVADSQGFLHLCQEQVYKFQIRDGGDMAIDHKFSNTGACQLGELLKSNGELIVPKFQRNFSWSNEKVSELWSDLMNGFQRVKDESELSDDVGYLLGSIVLVRHKSNKYWVIDGQQRLSVITMLFCVARDIIRENIASGDSNSSPDGYDKIMEVLENTRMGKHTSWKLVLNDTDKKMFRQVQEYEMDLEPQIKRITNLKPKTKSEGTASGKLYVLARETS